MTDILEYKTNYPELIGLAQLREILIIDRDHTAPKTPAAQQQRKEVLATVEAAIDAELRLLKPSMLPEEISFLEDAISRGAWAYLVNRQNELPLHAPTIPPLTAYTKLKSIFAKLGKFGEALVPLGFIRDAQFPHKDSLYPDEVILNKIIDAAEVAVELAMHKISTDPEIEALLEQAKSDNRVVSEADQKNLILMNAIFVQATGLSKDLVARVTAASSKCKDAFAKAKANNDFAPLEQPLDELMAALREKGAALGKELGLSPYDALLDERNPGLTDASIQPVFSELAEKLPKLVTAIKAKQAEEAYLAVPSVPVEVQKKIIIRVLTAMGFNPDKSAWGIANSGGAFADGSWGDARIVFGLNEKDFLNSLMGAVHENGHRLYFENLPLKHKYQPVAKWQSNWIHETQSMFWERMVAGSMPFMAYLSSVVKDELRRDAATEQIADNAAFEPANLYRVATRLKADEKLRIKADAVQYPLHVIVQSRIEKALLEGHLNATDVPAARNSLMKELLGIDTSGCIADGPAQDNHWTNGNYFPAYALGMMGAAQLWRVYSAQDPQVNTKIERGEFGDMMKWLAENVHSKGSLYSGQEIIQQVTGAPLSASAFLQLVEDRYLEQPSDRSGPVSRRDAMQVPPVT